MRQHKLSLVPVHQKRQMPVTGIGAAYHPGESNRCPCCNNRGWNVGRSSAECSGCGYPMPIAADGVQ